MTSTKAVFTMNDEETLAHLRIYLVEARKKHPKWPQDPYRELAVVCEEFGEFIAAVNQHHEDGRPSYLMVKEAYHLMVVVMRWLTEGGVSK